MLKLIGAGRVDAVFEEACILGCYIQLGKAVTGGSIIVSRKGEEIVVLPIKSIKIFAREVNEVLSGSECGIVVTATSNVKVGDTVELFNDEIAREDPFRSLFVNIYGEDRTKELFDDI